MTEFKIGDRVRNVSDRGVAGVPIGFEAEVLEIDANGDLKFQDAQDYRRVRPYEDYELVQPEGPVRTETVRKIVPGVYGRVTVGDRYGKGVWFEVSEGLDGGLVLTADELDALADTARQLAEALRDDLD